MYVYFIETATKPKLIKIGKSNDVDARLAQLQTACPVPLSVRHVITCDSETNAFEVEKLLHSVFSSLRTNGEWFKSTGALTKFISGAADKNKKAVLRAMEKHAKAASDGRHDNVSKAVKRAFDSYTPECGSPYLGHGAYLLGGERVGRSLVMDLVTRYLGDDQYNKNKIRKIGRKRGIPENANHILGILAVEALESGLKLRTKSEILSGTS